MPQSLANALLTRNKRILMISMVQSARTHTPRRSAPPPTSIRRIHTNLLLGFVAAPSQPWIANPLVHRRASAPAVADYRAACVPARLVHSGELEGAHGRRSVPCRPVGEPPYWRRPCGGWHAVHRRNPTFGRPTRPRARNFGFSAGRGDRSLFPRHI